MNTARHAVVASAIGAIACGGAPSDPGEGQLVAHLTSKGNTIGVSVDRGDVYVVLLDAAGSLRIAVDRVRGSEVTPMPLAPTDWSDYAAGGFVGLDPPNSTLVSGGKAYFLGQFGVTVVPLDGSPSRTLYEPDPLSRTGHAFNSLGAFAVDGESVYVCDSDLTTNNNDFGRFDANGTWERLFTGSLPSLDESCFGGAMAADADAVYWSTSQAIRAYSKRDGTVTTVVNLGGLALAPPLVAINGDSIAWFDWLDLAFHVADKKRMTPDTSSALGATALMQLVLTDPAPLSMLATGQNVYWQTLYDIHRLPTGEGWRTCSLIARKTEAASWGWPRTASSFTSPTPTTWAMGGAVT